MTTQLTFWAVNNLYHSPNSSYNEQAQEAFASKSMMRLFVPDALVGHIVDQLDAMVERGSDPDYDFDASDFDGAEVTPDNYLLLTVKQAVMFLRFLERDIHIADATDAQKRNFVNAYERIMKQTLVVMPDDTDPAPAPDGDDTPASDDVATEPTNEHPRAVYELIEKMAFTVDAYDECGAYIPRSMLKSNFPVRKLEKAGYVYLQDGYVYMTVKFWDIWYQTDPASYRQALHYGRISMAEHFAGTTEHRKYAETVRLMQWRIDLVTEPTPAPSDNPPDDNDPAPVLAEIMEWVAWNVESFGGDGTYHSVDLLPNINLDGLDKWLHVRNEVVHFRLAWWQLLAQDNPAVYHRALRNMILAKAQLSKALSGIQNTSYEKKRRRAYRRLDRIYRTVSRYKFGVE